MTLIIIVTLAPFSIVSTGWGSFFRFLLSHPLCVSLDTLSLSTALPVSSCVWLSPSLLLHVWSFLFSQITLSGPPQPLRSCSITNHSLTSLVVDCTAGDDGGLKQQFHIEVYATSSSSSSPSSSSTTSSLSTSSATSLFHQLNVKQQQSPGAPAASSSSSSYSSSGSSVPALLKDASLIHNVSCSSACEDRVHFSIEKLDSGSEYHLLVYSSNDRGRSSPLHLTGVTLGQPEKHTSQGTLIPSLFLFTGPLCII